MAEGYVSLSNIKIIICGPPYVDQRHAIVILKAIKDVVLELELFGTFLGLSDAVIQEIKINSPHEVQTRRKDIIIAWLETGTATRSALISALEDVKRFDIAAAVKRLPTV
uniref:Death domain-containing protein n=1 Tax=Amphimedon queenslandica TaxID=400682 RepID=A0A1X7TAX3_AMPQE